MSQATVNRCLQVISRILRKAQNEWEWIAVAPKVPMLAEPLERVRFLKTEEEAKLLAELLRHIAIVVSFHLQLVCVGRT